MPVLGSKRTDRQIERGYAPWPGFESHVTGTAPLPAGVPEAALPKHYSGAHPSREQLPQCPNPACDGGGTKLWWRRQAFAFEGAWPCGRNCLRAVVAAAIRREVGDGLAGNPAGPHRHRVPLGLVLLAQGWVTHPQLQKALAAQRQAGHGRIGDWLASECGVREEHVTRALGMQWSCPVLSVEMFEPEAMAGLVPRSLIDDFQFLPLRVAGRSILYIASEDRIDASAAFALERMMGLRVESGLLTGSDYQMSREQLLSPRMKVHFPAESIGTFSGLDALATAFTARIQEARPVEARLVRLHGCFWLRMWLKGAAGMVHAGGIPAGRNQAADLIYRVG